MHIHTLEPPEPAVAPIRPFPGDLQLSDHRPRLAIGRNEVEPTRFRVIHERDHTRRHDRGIEGFILCFQRETAVERDQSRDIREGGGSNLNARIDGHTVASDWSDP